VNGSRQKGREIEKTRKVMGRLEGRIAEAWKDGRCGGSRVTNTVHVKTTSASDEALHLVRAAVASEIARLELALEKACKRLKPFEEKYGVTSQQFIAEMAAEDLDGGDDEYVQWAGEYKLMLDLEEKLTQLREIQIQ
jgi:hypothetical protein